MVSRCVATSPVWLIVPTKVQSIERFRPVLAAAAIDGIPVRGYVSCVANCPYEGAVAPAVVADVTEHLLKLGCHEISGGITAMSSSADDERWMLRALSLAESAAAMDEVPVGAVVIRDDQLLGESGNRVVQGQDPCGHAEVLALRAAARKVRTHRLDGATLYGAVVSAFESLMPAARQQHRVAIDEGLCADQSRALLTRFFQTKR